MHVQGRPYEFLSLHDIKQKFTDVEWLSGKEGVLIGIGDLSKMEDQLSGSKFGVVKITLQGKTINPDAKPAFQVVLRAPGEGQPKISRQSDKKEEAAAIPETDKLVEFLKTDWVSKLSPKQKMDFYNETAQMRGAVAIKDEEAISKVEKRFKTVVSRSSGDYIKTYSFIFHFKPAQAPEHTPGNIFHIELYLTQIYDLLKKVGVDIDKLLS